MESNESEESTTKVHVDVDRRTVYITGSVDDHMAHQVVIALERLDAEGAEIRIVLNSEGGDVQNGYAIYDAVSMCKSVIIMEGYGNVCSIAAAIFQGGDIRKLAPHSDFMIHNGTIAGEEEMKQTDVLDRAEQIKRDSQKYYDILANRSGQPTEIIEEWCRSDTYFTAREAVDAGFADEVIKPVKKSRIHRKKRSK